MPRQTNRKFTNFTISPSPCGLLPPTVSRRAIKAGAQNGAMSQGSGLLKGVLGAEWISLFSSLSELLRLQDLSDGS